MAKISLMKPELANLIAAGEVIERPASVIKELVENSIDAGAKNIYIGVSDIGRNSIIVKDDGSGMGKEDATLCFLRHASSKIKNEYDLMRIHTLGFRGEAIPSIASISNIVLTTSDGNNNGTKVESRPNKELVVCSAPIRKGTIFEISNLFFNVPARLKYLKSDRVENFAIIDICEKIALGYPSISFTLVIDGKQIFKTTGRGDLLETIQLLYGNNLASGVYHIEKEENTFSFNGFISKPEIHYSRKNNINIFLNNRYITDYVISKAINEAYKDYLPPERYPFITIFLSIDPAAVDVNVHPTKREVRMSLENDIAFSLQKEIYNTLSTKKPIYEVKNDIKANTISNNNIEDAFNISEEEIKSSNQNNNQYTQEQINFPKSFDNQSIVEEIKQNNEISENVDPSSVSEFSYQNVFKNNLVNSNFPNLYPIGQVLQTYIVCNSDDGFYLIDQHAAAERVNYEKTEKLFELEKNRVMPLLPIVISLSHKETYNLDDKHISALDDLGIKIEKFGKNDIKVVEIPSFLIYDENLVIESIIHLCLSDEKVSISSLLHLSIADIACKKSIKANHIMSITEIQGLLSDLSKCKNPSNCPHGRPTMLKLTKYDVEKIFRRVGF